MWYLMTEKTLQGVSNSAPLLVVKQHCPQRKIDSRTSNQIRTKVSPTVHTLALCESHSSMLYHSPAVSSPTYWCNPT